jgi:hypothetical protein
MSLALQGYEGETRSGDSRLAVHGFEVARRVSMEAVERLREASTLAGLSIFGGSHDACHHTPHFTLANVEGRRQCNTKCTRLLDEIA